jgi:hypothetical protein
MLRKRKRKGRLKRVNGLWEKDQRKEGKGSEDPGEQGHGKGRKDDE